MDWISYLDLAATCQSAIEKLPSIEEVVPAEFARLDFLTTTEVDNVIADMIVGYCRNGEWQDMGCSIIWQLAFRLRFARNYFEKQHGAHPEARMPGQAAMIQMAVAATDIWHDDAGAWMAELTGAEKVLKGQYAASEKGTGQVVQLERLIKKMGDN